jgi:DNA mismatch repair protein MutS2
MHQGALKALEFERIVEVARSFALTPFGAGRLGDLRPLPDPAQVEAALAATTEGVNYLRDQVLFPLQAPAPLEAALNALAVDGRALEPLQLLAVADFLASIEEARQSVRRTARGAFPILHGFVEGAKTFDREVADIRQKIEPSGEVVDDATAELRGIRERLRRQRSRLRNTLESFLRGKETSRYLQDQVVTDRNGRYVLLVRSEHRSAIPGIVHGSSGTGASLFLEPLSTVEINNDIVALEQQEAEEVRRILLFLSQAFRGRALDLQHTIDAATELDVVQAKARFAQLVGGVQPGLSHGSFELKGARHPLLIPRVAAIARSDAGERSSSSLPDGPVPVDIVMAPPATVLVITGPNTGGKTVALKTAGLLALMAQAGLHVPALPGCQLPVFRSVFADIGDEQSIAASLSTFSWHLTNIAGMDRALALPALILLDEIGTGTEPNDGAALGMALLEHFRRRGAMIIATTHHDVLKSYASTTDGVVSAAFGFDPETYAPTYRLIYGAPGRSLALEIAARLGLPSSVIDEARQHRSTREAQLAEHLARIDHDQQALDHERRLAATERSKVLELEARLKAREEAVREREELLRRRLDEQLDRRLRDARREIDVIIADLKSQAAGLVAEARKSVAERGTITTGETGAARAGARAALESVERQFRRFDDLVGENLDSTPQTPVRVAAATVSGAAPVVGDRVRVGDLGLEGVVRLLHDREAEVEVRGKRLRVGTGDLQVIGGPVAPRAAPIVNVQLQPRDTQPTDLNVVGCSVDEALSRAEKFLDEALVAEQRSVRFIHGHGTGQLRRAIADFLQSHPLVAKVSTAPPEQGGGGVTVAELKE